MTSPRDSRLDRRSLLRFGGVTLGVGAVGVLAGRAALAAGAGGQEAFEVSMTPAEWRKRLTPMQFDVLREAGTEAPFSSPLLTEHRRGTFTCRGCELPAFSSATKFESGTGWPSFYAPLPHAVATRTDLSLGLPRTEVHCRRCGGHLGHLFDDGPKPTGLRYCMDGVALDFHSA